MKPQLTPWLIAGLATVAAVVIYFQKPKAEIQYIPKETIREVIKEVPKEVVREVPVEVVKEVPREFTDEENLQMGFGRMVTNAEIQSDFSIGGIKRLKGLQVSVLIGKEIQKEVNSDLIKSGIELEFRKLGIPISDPAQNAPTLCYQLNGSSFDGSVFIFTERLQVWRPAFLCPDKNEQWIFSNLTTVYDKSNYGSVGKSRVRELGNSYEGLLKVLLNDFLKANPPEKSSK
jgi:hypothetical protein